MADKLDNTRSTFESQDAQAASAIQSITGSA
jgi:adhesin HecA-like repeat protein